ncbi:MAG TPA: gluconate 2-dehydrogenase subunit 3 family protein [Thermomicrobiales bacterium]|jgi:gluconate 2-dehydrogenase gamma chain|nr:gluconate 2-dehydrogenase subunit 3 family protein [Thermomicrobiales bacterium]
MTDAANGHEPFVKPELLDRQELPSVVRDGRVTRRRFLIGAGAASGVAASAMALQGALGQQATPPASPAAGEMAGMQAGPPTNEGFVFFVPYQAAIIKAAAARLIPTDDLGPGATEAGVVYFIDRELAKTHESYRGPFYLHGPFMDGAATQGDQSSLLFPDRFRLGIEGMDDYAKEKFGNGFASLSADQQDQILTDMQHGIPKTFDGSSLQSVPYQPMPSSTESLERNAPVGVGAKAFFDLLLAYVIGGFFADPVHGGNRNMVGWKLIGFPGAHMSYRDEILKYGEPFTGPFISLGQYQEQVSGGA